MAFPTFADRADGTHRLNPPSPLPCKASYGNRVTGALHEDEVRVSADRPASAPPSKAAAAATPAETWSSGDDTFNILPRMWCSDSDHDTPRHMWRQPIERTNEQHARYILGMQPFVGAMTRVLEEIEEQSLPFKLMGTILNSCACFPLFWDGDVPQS
jgi:hypothetical protein